MALVAPFRYLTKQNSDTINSITNSSICPQLLLRNIPFICRHQFKRFHLTKS